MSDQQKPTPQQIAAVAHVRAISNQRNSHADEAALIAAQLAQVAAERDEALALVEQQRAVIAKLSAPATPAKPAENAPAA